MSILMASTCRRSFSRSTGLPVGHSDKVSWLSPIFSAMARCCGVPSGQGRASVRIPILSKPACKRCTSAALSALRIRLLRPRNSLSIWSGGRLNSAASCWTARSRSLPTARWPVKKRSKRCSSITVKTLCYPFVQANLRLLPYLHNLADSVEGC